MQNAFVFSGANKNRTGILLGFSFCFVFSIAINSDVSASVSNLYKYSFLIYLEQTRNKVMFLFH